MNWSPETLRLYASIYRKPRRYSRGGPLNMPLPFDLVRADLADKLATQLEDSRLLASKAEFGVVNTNGI